MTKLGDKQMKIAFISDIHGNAEALQAVLYDIEQRNVDEIFILGDICFRGIEPKRALTIVKELNTQIIKGNADEWVVRGIHKGEVPEKAFSMMKKERDWTYAQLDEEEISYLDKLPMDLNLAFNQLNIHAFHATPNSLFEVVQPDENDQTLGEKLMVKDADLYIYGHIHKSYIRYIDGKCLVNPGSIGLPFDSVKKASYFILELAEDSYQMSIVKVNYDIEKVISQIQKTDYPNKELLSRLLCNANV